MSVGQYPRQSLHIAPGRTTRVNIERTQCLICKNTTLLISTFRLIPPGKTWGIKQAIACFDGNLSVYLLSAIWSFKKVQRI